jgi:hypothetical protein
MSYVHAAGAMGKVLPKTAAGSMNSDMTRPNTKLPTTSAKARVAIMAYTPPGGR